MSRNTSRDGFRNKLESFFLLRFGFVWKILQAIPPLRRWLNKLLIRSAVLKTKTRPHQFSLRSDYTTWDSLTDRVYTGRHLPPADDSYIDSLPSVAVVTDLFLRQKGTFRKSKRSSVTLPNFAHWFTDGFLRTARNPHGDPNPDPEI